MDADPNPTPPTRWRARLAPLGVRDSNGSRLTTDGRWRLRPGAPLRWVPVACAGWQMDDPVGVCDRLETRDGGLWADVAFTIPPDPATVQAMLDRRLRPAFNFGDAVVNTFSRESVWHAGTVVCVYLSETPSFGVDAWFEPADRPGEDPTPGLAPNGGG
jgi:hypothetical protein